MISSIADLPRSVLASRSIVRRHPLWTIAVLALVVRIAYVLIARPDPLNMVDSTEYDILARQILAGRGIIDFQRFARPPLYPLLVAVCYSLGGITTLIAVQLLLSAITPPLVGVLARSLSGRAAAAPVAALITALYPWFFQWVGGLASETFFILGLVTSLVLVLRASDHPRTRSILLAGVVFGIVSLIRANALVLAPPIGLWWWWRARDVRPPAILAIGVVLALVPYMLYSLAAGKGLVVASSGGGENFYIGNNPDTVRLYDPATPEDDWRKLSLSSGVGPDAIEWLGCPRTEGQAECFDRIPAAEREAWFYRRGLDFIRAHPGEWSVTALRKLIHYWRPWVEPRTYAPAVVVLSGLSFGGTLLLALAGLGRMPRRAALFVLATIVGSTLSSVVWNVQLRYRFAMLDPVLIAAAGEPLVAILDRIRTSWSAQARRVSWLPR